MKYRTLLLMGLGLVALAGCAVGRGADGAIVLGIEAGVLVETVEQGIIGAAGEIPVVGNLVRNILIGAATSGVTVAGSAKALMMRQENRRRKSDMAREASDTRVAVLEAKLEAAREREVVVLAAKLESVNGGASA